jgi:hypothetical protein
MGAQQGGCLDAAAIGSCILQPCMLGEIHAHYEHSRLGAERHNQLLIARLILRMSRRHHVQISVGGEVNIVNIPLRQACLAEVGGRTPAQIALLQTAQPILHLENLHVRAAFWSCRRCSSLIHDVVLCLGSRQYIVIQCVPIECSKPSKSG